MDPPSGTVCILTSKYGYNHTYSATSSTGGFTANYSVGRGKIESTGVFTIHHGTVRRTSLISMVCGGDNHLCDIQAMELT